MTTAGPEICSHKIVRLPPEPPEIEPTSGTTVEHSDDVSVPAETIPTLPMDKDGVGVTVGEGVAVAVGSGVPVTDGVGVILILGVTLTLGVGVAVGDTNGEADTVIDGVIVIVGVTLGVGVG